MDSVLLLLVPVLIAIGAYFLIRASRQTRKVDLDNPDFESMSPQELMNWMEALAASKKSTETPDEE